MKSFTAIRQDQRFYRPTRSVVSIAEEVFEARPGTIGRRWILDPPLDVRCRFWELFGETISSHDAVFVAEGGVLLEALRDVHERPIPGLEGRAGEAALFFVDLAPEANWAHPCEYIVLPKSGEPSRAKHDWPPSDSVRFVPLPRPAGR